MYTYPEEIKVFIDDIDITFYIFGTDTYSPDDTSYYWHDIDLGPFLDSGGTHKVTIKATTGSGRIDCRIEIQ